MKKKSIEDRILDYLKAGNKISQWDAIDLFKYTRLSATIFNLKERGYNIADEWCKSESTGKKFKRYWIPEEDEGQYGFGFKVEPKNNNMGHIH